MRRMIDDSERCVPPTTVSVAPEVAKVAKVAPEVAKVAPTVAPEVAPKVAKVAPKVAKVAPEVVARSHVETQTDPDEQIAALQRMLAAQANQIVDLRSQLNAQRSERVDWSPRPDYLAAAAIRRAIETLAPHALMSAAPRPTICDAP
jgi:hypothetical protein